jgi:hypothetical protein
LNWLVELKVVVTSQRHRLWRIVASPTKFG